MQKTPVRIRLLATTSLVATVTAASAFAQTTPTTPTATNTTTPPVGQPAGKPVGNPDGAADVNAGISAATNAGTNARARRAIDGTSLGGFVFPTKALDGGCTVSAIRGWRWKTDDTQRLYLEGDVRVAVGGYSFSAKRASVWINRLPLANGAATQVAIWFERADEPTRRAGLGASGRDLLVTTSYLGETKLSLVAPEDGTAPDAAFLAAGNARLARYLQQLSKGIDDGTVSLSARPTVNARS
ncbi:MAG: hypothetical protein RL591_2475, partial [Planctomycetota bacterium]